LAIVLIVTIAAFIICFALIQYSLDDTISSTYAQEGENYERKLMRQDSLAVTELGQIRWTNNDYDTLSVSTETNAPIFGNASLRVDIKPAATAKEIINTTWRVITTDFIPANKNGYHNYSLDVSAKDVNQLHSKLYHFDSNRKEISSDFIFGGRDGTFKQEFNNSILSPVAAKYMQLQMWVKPSLGKNASYLIDNINLGKNVTYLLDNIQIVGEDNVPSITDNASHLSVELVFRGLNSSNMAFLGPNDILVLDGNNGKVYRILNGQMLEEPVIDLNSFYQDGLIGIATVKNQNGQPYVFLYLNEAAAKYGNDVNDKQEAGTVNRTLGYDREGDRLYRYKLVGNKLVEPKLLFEIKAPRPSNNLGVMHHGGEVLIGPDGLVYFVIGELGGSRDGVRTKAQNYKDGIDPDGRAGILRMTQNGTLAGEGILGDSMPLRLYYAYGIRNSFGLAFDPITGFLWDTENGPAYGDEINLVEPGFNSGTDILWGMSTEYDNLDNLVNFTGRGKYSNPEFVWNDTVAPTALTFLNSDKLGKQYENDMFVGDFNNGNIYHFDLNENRTELILPGSLKDKVSVNSTELQDIVFANNFGGITDLLVGPDGYLYVAADGKIFKIRPIKNQG